MSFKDSGSHWYNTWYYKCKYHSLDGKIHGKYVSYYPSGKKKAEGTFNNNYRVGEWKIYDSTGTLVINRFYKNPFEATGTKLDSTENTTAFKLEKDEAGCYKHIFLKDKRMFAASRYWRFVSAEFNDELFNNNRLYNLTCNLIYNGSINAYTDDSIKTKINPQSIDTSKYRFIGFRTMEDWFIERDRMVLENYLIAFAPLGIDKKTGDTSELFWVERTHLRKFLVKETVNNKNIQAYVQNLDDLLYFHA